LAAAQRHGARLLAEARVDRVELGDGRVSGVRGLLRGEQVARPFHVAAGTVVAAAGALRTPLLLAASGVVHPQLGRNLRLHPVVAVAAFMAEPVEAWRGPSQAARSLQFCRAGSPDAQGIGPAHGGFVIESAPPHPGLFASALPWTGAREGLALLDRLRWVAPLIGIVRDHGSGRVRTSRGGRPRIEYRLDRADGATARRALVEMARLARAGGARRIMSVATPPAWWEGADGDAGFERFARALARQPTAANRVSLFSAHQMGTARAGADASAHPCDPGGRVRTDTAGGILPGAYVGDASLFPTASGVNPMLTVMALAERTARAVLADRR
ncbi:MAG TPA: GMC family oxidoreductase, partial [Candidatus Limnocylindria bacterium]|nr:GMC family oxidoreductase [Candidatus Limnocylindria bacterium]